MLFYFAVAMLAPIFGAVKNGFATRHRAGRLGLLLLLAALAAIVALRAETVGTDALTTIKNYMATNSMRETGRSLRVIAPVYYSLSYCLFSLFPFPQAILVFCAVVTMACFFYFMRKFSDDVYLSIFLFITLGFYTISFNAIRQMLALSIMLVSASFIYSRRNIPGIILAALSCGIHITALIFLPMLFLFYWKKINNIFILACISCSVVCVAFRDAILSAISLIVSAILPSYNIYVYGSTIAFGNPSEGRIIWLYIFYLLILLGVYYLSNVGKNKILNAKARLLIVPVSIGVAIGCIGIHNPLFARLCLYYSVFIIILLPLSLQYFDSKSKLLLKIIVMATALVPFYVTLAANHADIIPYKVFF